MGRYFGSEPRFSREEIERQAQEAIDARVSLGRPPDEDWRPLEQRLAEIDQAAPARPPVEPLPEPQPLRITEIRMPGASPATDASTASPTRKAPSPKSARRPVAARSRAN